MKQELLKLISQGKANQAIKQLLAFSKQIADADLQQEIILQAARFEQNAKENRLGISTSEQSNITIAKINHALFAIIDNLPDSDNDSRKTNTTFTKAEVTTTPIEKTNIPSQQATTPNSWWKYVTAAAVIIGIFGSLAEILNFINIFPNSGGDTSQITVYVHGTKGIQDYVLEGKGELLIDLDGDRRSAKIGEKGRTVFSGIPAKFKGKELPIAVKANGFEQVEPNKRYKWNGEAIYFPIRTDTSLLHIKGIVKNKKVRQFYEMYLF